MTRETFTAERLNRRGEHHPGTYSRRLRLRPLYTRNASTPPCSRRGGAVAARRSPRVRRPRRVRRGRALAGGPEPRLRGRGRRGARADGRPARARRPALRAGGAARRLAGENAAAIRRSSPARSTAARRDAILLNAAGAIAAAGHAEDLARGAGGRARGRRLGRGRGAARGARRVLAGVRVQRTRSPRPGLAAIAEVKRRSPSAGDLRPGRRPGRARARASSARARAAISVLVDERFARHGRRPARRARRDRAAAARQGLLLDRGRARELRDAGADAALLILRDLDDATTARADAHARGDRARHARRGARRGRARARGRARRRPDRDQRPRPLHLRDRPRARSSSSSRARRATASSSPRARSHSRAQGAAAELAGADAILVGTALMRARRPGREAPRAALAPAREGLRADPRGGRRRRRRGGRRPRGFILAPESPRARRRACSTSRRRCSRSRSSSARREDDGADLVQLYARENGHRGRDAVLLRDGERVATVRRPALGGRRPGAPRARAGGGGPRHARRRARRRRTSARRSRRCARGPSTRARASSRARA